MLKIQNLSVEYERRGVVKDVSLTLSPGEIYCITGRSGSGKSTILNAVNGTLGASGRITGGRISLSGEVLCEGGKYTPAIRRMQGRQLAWISQYPDRSFDPLFPIGRQMREVMLISRRISKAEAKEEGCRLFEKLHLADSERVWNSYPHELSGGMCQRVAIAMALANRAELLLADEPTSALDVTIQAELVKLLKEVAKNDQLGILLVTHNMDVAHALSDRIGVLKDGKLMEVEDQHVSSVH